MRGKSVCFSLAILLGASMAASAQAQMGTTSPRSSQGSGSAAPQAQSGTTSLGSAQGSGGAAPQGQSAPLPQAPLTSGSQSQTGGRQFGEHVSGMAPEHPLMHGRLFGECVSEMAITGTCPHDDF